MVAYHDWEWGVPLHDDRKLFGFLVPAGARAGLSWSSVLRKRENFRKAFHGFDQSAVACYKEKDVQGLLRNAGIIRNRSKIEAAITNATMVLEIQEGFGSLHLTRENMNSKKGSEDLPLSL
jgi:DNA-3-methyladenine glycosylase I